MARYTFFNGQVFISEGTYFDATKTSDRVTISSVLLFVKIDLESKHVLNSIQKLNAAATVSNTLQNV